MTYFLLTFAISIPFWVAGALTHLQLLPGIPISAIGVLCMVGSASILAYRENGLTGIKGLLKRSFDFKRVRTKIWFLPTILLMPAIMILSFFVLRLMGVTVPGPQFSITTPFILFAVFFVAAIGEELGWMGYAMDPLQDRFGALGGALLLGGVWAVWHFVPLLSVQRSLAWIAWWALGTVALRVIITWHYNNTGRSVFVAVIFHTMSNLTWELFPINGSYYDPRVTSLIMTLVAVGVVIASGPRTLVRIRKPRESSERDIGSTAKME